MSLRLRERVQRAWWLLTSTTKFWPGGRRARLCAVWHSAIKGHPYEICGDCGRPVAAGTGPAWWGADDELWLEVYGDPNGVTCPGCFAERADQLGIILKWTPTVEGRYVR